MLCHYNETVAAMMTIWWTLDTRLHWLHWPHCDQAPGLHHRGLVLNILSWALIRETTDNTDTEIATGGETLETESRDDTKDLRTKS